MSYVRAKFRYVTKNRTVQHEHNDVMQFEGAIIRPPYTWSCNILL